MNQAVIFLKGGRILDKDKIAIQYSKQAIKFLQKQEPKNRKRIIDAIEHLPFGDVKKLSGSTQYRLRVGSYRIIFDRNGKITIIEKIDNRGEVYKGV